MFTQDHDYNDMERDIIEESRHVVPDVRFIGSRDKYISYTTT
jgi:hypothetical protein